MTAAATQARSARASILRDIAKASPSSASRELAAAHLDSPHPALSTLGISDLVAACRGVGRWHMRKILNAARVDGMRRLGDLTDRERDHLARALREPWPREGS